MAIRGHYDYDLAELERRLVTLAETVEQSVVRAMLALNQRDLASAERIIQGDTTIDTLRYDAEERALQLMARHQPMARDLRIVNALMDLAAELERIGDYAEGIAEVVVRSAELPNLEIPAALDQMALAARDMLQQAMRAIGERDASAVDRLEHADDTVDQLYQQVLQQMLATMRSDGTQSEGATYLLWAAHNLERIADRTVNIAERAAFIATGMLGPRRA